MFLISIGAVAFSSALASILASRFFSGFLPKKEANEVYPLEIEFLPAAAFYGDGYTDFSLTTAGITTAGAAATTTSFLLTTGIDIYSFFLT